MDITDNKKEALVDFFNAKQGLACWKKCKEYNGNIYIAYAKIRVFIMHDDYIAIDRLREFIKTLFKVNDIFEKHDIGTSTSYSTVTFTVFKQFEELENNAEVWLTSCTLLNTYRDFFIKTTGISKMKILCGINSYESKEETEKAITQDILSEENYSFAENLAINDIVYSSTSAKGEISSDAMISLPNFSSETTKYRWYAYNLFYAELSENLRKE